MWLGLGVFVIMAAVPVAALAACPKVVLQLSAAGFHQLIKDEGGFKYYRLVTLSDGTRAKRWVPYDDSKHYCTVGHGHLIAYGPCTPAQIKKWTLTNAQADAWLAYDVQSRVNIVNRLVTRGLNQAQFDALVDFVYNAGPGKKPFRDKNGRLRKLGLIGSGILDAVNSGDFTLAGNLILRYISRQERISSPGLIPRRDHEATPFLHVSEGDCPKRGKPTPVPKPPPPNPSPPPPPDCAADKLTEPPSAGCNRVKIQVIPAPLPSDPGNEAIGEGVGTATVEPEGDRISCLNPSDAEACVLEVDVPTGAPISVVAVPGSLAGDASSPPDSAFEKYAGSCTGTGGCTLTPTSNDSQVEVYFVPSMVTLTLNASGDGGHSNMTANGWSGGAVEGTEPMSPVYCGASFPSNPLPCSLEARVDNTVQVEADTGGDASISLSGFSSNCKPSTEGPDFCDVVMDADQTVTAEFTGG